MTKLNGLYTHLSISPSLGKDHLLAGILSKLNSLCSFGLANIGSYHRVVDEAAGRFVGWGTENCDLPVRKISPGHWELRSVDATANMYLFLATVLSSGSVGIQNSTKLEWQDCQFFPQQANHKQLTDHGIVKSLPETPSDALSRTKGDGDIKSWAGAAIFDKYLAIKDKLRGYAEWASRNSKGDSSTVSETSTSGF